MKPILVRDLALEHWPSMDRYAEALASRIPGAVVPDAWTMKGERYLTRLWRYPKALRQWQSRGDLVHILDHSYSHCLRAFPGLPSVITVHDLLPLRILAEDGRTMRMRMRDHMLRWVLEWMVRADRFIVSTAWVGRELERYFNVDPERVHIVPYGVDEHFHHAPADAVLARRRAAWGAAVKTNPDLVRVVLHVGSCAPRKNVESAIRALGLLRGRGLNAILVQIGGQWAPSHHAAMREAGVEAFVIQERKVPEAELVSAYYAADVLAMPSTFEGYGLPAVEAMACGLPVVTSGAGGLREAVGEAALVTRTLDASSLAEALAAALEDPVCHADLIARGKARAQSLTWDRTAKETMDVYSAL